MKPCLYLGMLLAVLVGCASTPDPIVPVPDLGGIVNPDAGKTAAERAMWPFALAGFLGLLGGLLYLILFKDWRMMAAAAVIALIPPFFFLFLTPLVLPVSILCLGAGLAGLALLVYKVYDYIEDDVRAEREARRKERENVQ